MRTPDSYPNLDRDFPTIVAAEPRYRREVMTLFGGERRLTPVWHLDGIAWHDIPPPPRRGHEHVAQTVAFLGPFEEVWRCPCAAITRRGGTGWLRLSGEERFAEPARRTWLARLLRRPS